MCLPGRLLKWGNRKGHLGVTSAITTCTVMAGCRANSASFHTLLVHPRAPSPGRDVEPPSPAPEAAERQQRTRSGDGHPSARHPR